MDTDTFTDEFDLAKLFWLLPNHIHPVSLIDDIRRFETIFDDVRVYNDPNECLDDLTSLTIQENVFVVLGSGRPHLAEIFCSVSTLNFIYLTKIQHYDSTSHIRGVFPTTQQLFDQIKKDLNIVENVDTHLRVSNQGESRQHQATTSNLPSERDEFHWPLFLFHIILDMSRKDNRSNKDLIQDCRHIYRNNPKQLQLIDEFIKTYQPSDAIRWYTRDTFLYRLLNMALRTENVLIIFKFRFIIQDIYQQLKNRFRKTDNILRVYRGQRISQLELEHLRCSIGRSISLTSFTSTSKNVEIARLFAGNGEERPTYESVIFDISIDPTELDEDTLPYADIADVSVHEDKNEILLCMETTMVLEKIHVENAVTWIHLRMSRQNMSTTMEVKRQMFVPQFDDVDEEFNNHFLLFNAMLYKGDLAKMMQLMGFFFKSDFFVYPDYVSLEKELRNVSYMKLSDNGFKNQFKKLLSNIRNICQFMMRPDDGADDYVRMFESIDNFCQSLDVTQWQMGPNTKKMLEQVIINLPSQTVFKNVFQSLANHGTIEKCDDNSETLSQKIVQAALPQFCFLLSQSGKPSIDHLRYSLSSMNNFGMHQLCYRSMATIHEEREEWSEAIDCYQNMINQGETSANSLVTLRAHVKCGDSFVKLQDFDKALQCYTVALDILHQHYQSDHPWRSKILQRIQDVNQQLQQKRDAVDSSSPTTANDGEH